MGYGKAVMIVNTVLLRRREQEPLQTLAFILLAFQIVAESFQLHQ
jgi:hypothetical protein